MHKNLKSILAILVVILITGCFGAVVWAASDNSAQNNSIQNNSVQNNSTQNNSSQNNSAQTQKENNALSESQSPEKQFKGNHKGRLCREIDKFAIAQELIEKTEDELKTLLKEGKSLKQILSDAGKLDEFNTVFLKTIKEKLDAKVAEGKITQEKADSIYSKIEQKVKSTEDEPRMNSK